MIKSHAVQAGFSPSQADAIGGRSIGALTAIAGPAQNTAAICPGAINIFTTVPANGACILGAQAVGSVMDLLNIGDEIYICNYGANTLSIFPPVGAKILNGTVNAAVTLSANLCSRFKKISATDYGQG